MTAHNCTFQITLSKNGHVLAKTEWSGDKDALIELADAINMQCRDIRATFETQGRGYLQIPGGVKIGG